MSPITYTKDQAFLVKFTVLFLVIVGLEREYLSQNVYCLEKKRVLKKSTTVILIVLIVLILDQVLKIWVKTNLEYGEEIKLLGLNWARIHFVENKGMAFGWELGGNYGKLILSLFRIFAVGFLVYYIRLLINKGVPLGLLTCFGLILAGAIGNIIDSAFYGLIFSETPHHGVATLFPEGGGYAGFLHGKVVDMLYFPMFKGHYPDWFPVVGGNPFLFFGPVFNLADTAISVGVISLILFHRDFFSAEEEKEPLASTEVVRSTLDVKEAENEQTPPTSN